MVVIANYSAIGFDEGRTMHVLAIGAHPDDIELGCAGTLLRHVSHGDDVLAVVVTNGEAQKGVDWHARMQEADEAASLIGVATKKLGYEERQVCFTDHKLVGDVRRVVEQFDPSVVYCHCEDDDHQTHVAVARASLTACKLAGVPTVLSYEVPSTRHGFAPTMLVDVTAYLEGKLAALGCFESQSERYYMLREMIAGKAHVRAFEARLEPNDDGTLCAAEAFQVERMIVL